MTVTQQDAAKALLLHAARALRLFYAKDVESTLVWEIEAFLQSLDEDIFGVNE